MILIKNDQNIKDIPIEKSIVKIFLRSDEYSLRSINLILDNFNDYVFSRSYENITKIIQASNFSGFAINITKTTAPHALSYVLTSYFGRYLVPMVESF